MSGLAKRSTTGGFWEDVKERSEDRPRFVIETDLVDAFAVQCFIIRFAIREAAGKAIAPSTKAKGQAIRAVLGHSESQSAVGPRAISDIMPDMVTAIIKVIIT